MIATASERNQDFLRELGAEPLDYADGDIPARVREITGDGGADAALDLFGGDGREEAFAALRRGGRFVSVAQPPPEPRDGYEVHYVFVRPDGDELRELAELVRGRPAAPAHRGGLPARARRRGARAPRGRARARQARAQRPGLNSSVPIDPSSASVAPSVSTKKPTRGRASAWS